MKTIRNAIASLVILLITSVLTLAQEASRKIVITGVRFSYPLVEQWIKDYQVINPEVKISIDPRGNTADPTRYDLLIEAYELDKEIREAREFLFIGRYALLPVANAHSEFARIYSDKGLTKNLIKQIFFHDIYADKKEEAEIKAPYTIYTRLQKAGAPITFAKYFGYTQQNIKGKAISGTDEHLVKALLKDSTGVTYAFPGLLYDHQTHKPLDGLSIIPVDLNGNGRVSDDEKIFSTLDDVTRYIESTEDAKKLDNLPVADIHLSVSKLNKNPEVIKFLYWVLNSGQTQLHEYGFLSPEPKLFQQQKEKFEQQVVLN